MTVASILPRVRGRPPLASAVALLGAVLAALVAAPAALADTTQSSNWAGYAAHSSRVHFTHVFGAWRQPSATCTAGTPTYSSEWVGLGGYSASANALEQIGSEVDCSASGKVLSTAWYELVPAPSRTIRMTVNPGDDLTAGVTVTGHQVRLQLSDLTRHSTFSRTVHVRQLDTSSADWILEAPSQCSSATNCQQLPLADFGTTAMTRASTRTNRGHAAAISDPLWTTTAIALASGGRRFIGSGGGGGVTATPSSLVFGGTAFAVTYAGSGGASGSGGPTSAGSAPAGAAHPRGDPVAPRLAALTRTMPSRPSPRPRLLRNP